MTLAEQYISPWYAKAREMFGVLPTTPIYSDIEPLANAEGKLENGIPWFAWRSGYPSPALDPVNREREAKRTACHEIGHPFEKLVPSSREKFAAWRGFDWHTWEVEGRQPREFFADAFGAALSGEWITPIGLSEADRHRYELAPVTAEEARDFFLALVGRSTVDYALARWVMSPNFTPGREVGPQYIVDHWTVGTAESCIRTFQSSASQVSAHYLVARDGTVYQFVRERDRAWHNGQAGWNDISIGIEHEHIPGQDWPAIQIAASRALHRDIGLPAIGHNETGYPTQCPGDLPLEAITEDELAFMDDPAAKAYREDVRTTFEAIKTVLAELSTRVASINAANDHTHEGVASVIVKTGGPVAR